MTMQLPYKIPTANRVLKSIAPVIANARFVAFDLDAARRFADDLKTGDLNVPGWDLRFHFHDGKERTVQYLFLLDSLNFCFWGDPRWGIEFKGAEIRGYNALAAALRLAVEEGQPVLDAEWMVQASREDVANLLEGNVEAPLLDSRVEIIREIGDGLLRLYGGQAANMVSVAGRSAWKLVDLLLADFPNFRDVAYYGPRQVLILKRAQIFCADLYGAFGGQKWGEFRDIGDLTAFADYRLPQLLRKHGVLFYSPDLADQIDQMELIPAGSDEEIEIRAMTIYAVEVLRALLKKNGVLRTSIELDWILWGRTRSLESPPHHRTITTCY